jgi:hypothetical protein
MRAGIDYKIMPNISYRIEGVVYGNPASNKDPPEHKEVFG